MAEQTIVPTPVLTSEQTGEVLHLLEGADSVELKLTVPDTDQRSAVAALEMDVLRAQIRQVAFFDTRDLDLNRCGLVLRARRVQARDADTVVKLRPVEPADLPSGLRSSDTFGVEVDAMPGGFVCSASMKAKHADSRVKEGIAGTRPISKLFTKEQRRFFTDHAPASVGFDDLIRLGPINILKLKLTPEGFGRRLVAELWFYPDGTRLLELSTKCSPAEAFHVAAESKVFLTERGIDLTGEQATKTRTALEYFVGTVAGPEPAS